MKRWWNKLAMRIDALSLRERGILFVSLLAVSLFAADALWLSPVQALHRQLTQQFSAQNAELQRLQDELKSSGGEGGPGKQMRDELAQAKERLETVNKEIARLPAAGRDEANLPKVLVHFLRQHEGLSLVRTGTVPPDTKAILESGLGGLTRQSLELTVAGPYLELMHYVRTLEQSLPALRWGSMKISGDKQPVLLTLQVYLVEVPQ